ncbi:alkylated DNA nucleotide flippase Atl1 [Duganella sp. 1411]|uniref:MGMT family protein n=1 Tax=Duganella sp. 1411 TaxID=2806572 RepID=UPI001AE65BE6|nr:alkylated DNA nucleotide flippase Atl1 [Duganella sp. 1411]
MEQLYLKTGRGEPMQAADALTLVAGLGVDGDLNAHRLSPRQMLVTVASELEALALPAGALRENLVISTAAPEHVKPGAALVGAGGLEIRLTMYCEPCKQLLPLVADLAGMIGRRGVLGVVVRGGRLRRGEVLDLIPGRHPALPESPYQKFLDFIPTIPRGKVVRYADVAMAIGADHSFVRAIPGYIKRSLGADLPSHRIVSARGHLLATVPDQARRLAAEGVPAASAAVDLDTFLWRGEPGGGACMTVGSERTVILSKS